MRDLNYDFKQICRHNRDGSCAEQADRQNILDLIADQLHELGFRGLRAQGFKPKHVEKLVECWLAEELAPGNDHDEAMAVLRDQLGKHKEAVFTYRRKPLKSVNTKGWEAGLKRAGIENFRWHDLRHVWGTWHVIAGTSLGELQELGAGKSETMVKRYAHFAPEQLHRAADRPATFWSTAPKVVAAETKQAVD